MSNEKALKYKERLKSLKSKSLSELKSILKTQLRITSTTGYGKDTAISEILENEFGSKFMDEMNKKHESTPNKLELLKSKFEAISTSNRGTNTYNSFLSALAKRIGLGNKVGSNLLLTERKYPRITASIFESGILLNYWLNENTGQLIGYLKVKSSSTRRPSASKFVVPTLNPNDVQKFKFDGKSFLDLNTFNNSKELLKSMKDQDAINEFNSLAKSSHLIDNESEKVTGPIGTKNSSKDTLSKSSVTNTPKRDINIKIKTSIRSFESAIDSATEYARKTDGYSVSDKEYLGFFPSKDKYYAKFQVLVSKNRKELQDAYVGFTYNSESDSITIDYQDINQWVGYSEAKVGAARFEKSHNTGNYFESEKSGKELDNYPIISVTKMSIDLRNDTPITAKVHNNIERGKIDQAYSLKLSPEGVITLEFRRNSYGYKIPIDNVISIDGKSPNDYPEIKKFIKDHTPEKPKEKRVRKVKTSVDKLKKFDNSKVVIEVNKYGANLKIGTIVVGRINGEAVKGKVTDEWALNSDDGKFSLSFTRDDGDGQYMYMHQITSLNGKSLSDFPELSKWKNHF